MRIDGDTKGPLAYRQLYTLRNPWAQWLAFHAPKLLALPPSSFWEMPVMTKFEIWAAEYEGKDTGV